MNRKVELYAPPDYWRLSPEQKKLFCNGCGPGSWKIDLVPDYPLGFPFTEPCNIHDYMYAVGKTLDDKCAADRVLRNNMLRVVDAIAVSIGEQELGRDVAMIYFEAVEHFGGTAFWNGKNRPEELCEIEVNAKDLLVLEVE